MKFKTMEELQIDDIVNFVTGEGVQEYMQRRNARSLTLETKPEGMLAFDVPTFGDIQILQEPSATATTTPDLASMGLDLCAACNAKVAAFLEAQRKRVKGNTSPFDSNGEFRPDFTNEAQSYPAELPQFYRDVDMTPPEMYDTADLSLTLNHTNFDTTGKPITGLRVPDEMPSEQMAQLKALLLARPIAKQPEHKLTLEQIRALGWNRDEPTYVYRERTPEGMIIPD